MATAPSDTSSHEPRPRPYTQKKRPKRRRPTRAPWTSSTSSVGRAPSPYKPTTRGSWSRRSGVQHPKNSHPNGSRPREPAAPNSTRSGRRPFGSPRGGGGRASRRPPSPRSRSPPPHRRPTSRRGRHDHAKSSTRRHLRGRYGDRCYTPTPSPAPTDSASSSGNRKQSTRSTSGLPRPPSPLRRSRQSTMPTAPSPPWPADLTRPPPPTSPF